VTHGGVAIGLDYLQLMPIQIGFSIKPTGGFFQTVPIRLGYGFMNQLNMDGYS
jgi:hypothetical protein